MRCPTCSRPLPADARFCPGCGTASKAPAATEVATRTSVSGGGSFAGDPSGPAIDGARFAPGTVLADRYRIIGLLGRGGMGEVYRADDLKLGQPVALKFLPASMERDPSRLARLMNEVRTALRVTHPNVCRVHDVGELDGRHYLSMEYVDGEDLASLLRRIGHLPGPRAVRAARQLCAGLAAAHARGVLHRDLKPSNVMIDGRGEVKITDFGLAGAIGGFEGDEIRIGTPAYMAPEQLEGREVTVRSDLYALGLVLYELFSGRPAFDDTTPEAIGRRSEVTPPSLTSAADGVDPAVARIVDRCLATDPGERPGSATAVAAALPGGDPLAAALAAGETPSPELVAEAGASEGLRPAVAVALAVAAIIGIAGAAWLSTRTAFASRAGLDRPPAVLLDRAEGFVDDAGWGEGIVDSVYAWLPRWSYYQHVRRADGGVSRWQALGRTRPGALVFSFRASPAELEPMATGTVGNWMGDPPALLPGMVEVRLDPTGRLIGFQGRPEYVDAYDDLPGDEGDDADFAVFFAAAELDRDRFATVEPTIRPPSFADRRHAWTGPAPYDIAGEAVELRIEASSLRGRPVTFDVRGPWDAPGEKVVDRPGFWQRVAAWADSVSFVVVLIGASLLAARNVRLGRGDHRTALRFGLYLAAVRMVWLLIAHPAGDFSDVLRGHLGWAAYRLCLSYIFYMALEPYARRLWPQILVSWVRLFSGRPGDPRVGRDLLIGVVVGCGMVLGRGLPHYLSLVLEPARDGLRSEFWSWESLRGLRSSIAAVSGLHVGAVLENLTGVMLFLVVRIATRSTKVAVALTTTLAFVLFSSGNVTVWTYVVSFAAVVGLFWWTLFRAGLLAVLTAWTVAALLSGVRVTFEPGAWHALPMWLAYGTVVGVATWGFRAAVSGRRLFRDEIHGAGPGP